MGNHKPRDERTDLVPRHLDLGPTVKSHIERLRTQHGRFALPDAPYPGWVSYASQRHIRDVAIDSFREWIWLATWGGVLCWDPKARRCIRHTSGHGLVGNVVRSIAVDRAGVIWAAGHRRGLCSLRLDAHTAWQLHKDLERWTVLWLTPRIEGGIYVALRDSDGQCALGQVATPDDRLRSLLTTGLSIKEIDAFCVENDGTLWMGNPWGLYRYRNGNTESFDLAGAQVRAIASSPSEWLWVGTNHGLYRFDPEQDPPHFQDAEWPRDAVVSLTIEPDSGDLWGLTARQVGRLYDGVWQPAFQMPSERLNGLSAVSQEFKDKNPQSPVCLQQGRVWAGGANGLYKIGLDSYEEAFAYATEDALSNAVQALWADDSAVWVGSACGLYSFDGQTWFNYTRDAPNLRDVRAIAPGHSNGQLWIGAWQMGLQRLQQGVYIPDEALTQPIVALATGVDETMWAATVDAVYWQPQGSQKWESLPHPIPRDLIRGGIIQTMCHQLATDTGGNPVSTLWVGTSAGLFRYRPGLELWDWVKGDLEKLSVQALALDPLANRLWVGTSAGLFGENNWQCCRETDVQALAFSPAPAGTLWLGTSSGLESWSSPAQGEVFEGQPEQCFTASNSGLASDQVTALAIRVVESKQEVWVGSPNGVSRYQTQFK
jgi:ligand-binding sensor domain-containing protein